MHAGKVILAGLIAGIVAFMFRSLMYGIVLEDFFIANAGTAEGVERGEDILMIPLIIGHLAWGLLLAYIIAKIRNIKTFAKGAVVGAAIGFLGTTAVHLIRFGTTNLTTLNGTLVNIVALTVISAIIGGIVGWIYASGMSSELLEEEWDAADAA